MDISFECQTRSQDSKPRALRRQGMIPGVLYGHKGTESVSLSMTTDKVNNLLKKASVNNTLVDLTVTDLPWTGKVLIREVQSHPWKNNIYHLSFFSVATHGRLDITVPVRLVGEAKSLKQGGILEQLITEVQVQCLAHNIPEAIDIDISECQIGTSFHISELHNIEGVTIMDEPERIIFTIVAAAKAPESETETEVELS